MCMHVYSRISCLRGNLSVRRRAGASIAAALWAIFARWTGEDEAWASALTLAGREALQSFVAEACRARYATTATLVVVRTRHPPTWTVLQSC